MNLLKLTLIIWGLFFTTGCSIESRSPEQLIKEKPIYSENRENIYNKVNESILDATLELPKNFKEVGKINEEDLDSDGINEIIAFSKILDQNKGINEVGFTILSKNDNENYDFKESQYVNGDFIEYANFYDLNNDGHKEIIILSKINSMYYFNIFSYKNNEISKLYSLGPIVDNLDVKMSISDINDDKENDIILITFSSITNKAKISILNFNEKLKLKGSIEIDEVKNINDLYITIGNVTPKKKGLVLDIPTIYNKYKTQIIIFEEGKLKKALNDIYTIKPYYIPSQDFNNDKVIEIPIGYIAGNNYNKNEASNVSWYRWNGKFDDDSEIVFTSEIYYNYKYNFKFLLPNNIAKKLEVTQKNDNKDTLFKFSYYDEFGNLKDLFGITVTNKKVIDESKVITNSNSIILNESIDNTFMLDIYDIEEMKKLNITEKSLKEYFSLIY